MKFFGPAVFGVAAAVTSYISTLCHALTAAALLIVALVLWVMFIVYMIRAARPD